MTPEEHVQLHNDLRGLIRAHPEWPRKGYEHVYETRRCTSTRRPVRRCRKCGVGILDAARGPCAYPGD